MESTYDKTGQLVRAVYLVKLWKDDRLVSKQKKVFCSGYGRRNWIGTKLVEFCKKLEMELFECEHDWRKNRTVTTEWEML